VVDGACQKRSTRVSRIRPSVELTSCCGCTPGSGLPRLGEHGITQGQALAHLDPVVNEARCSGRSGPCSGIPCVGEHRIAQGQAPAHLDSVVNEA
jgi:hypothetical protein